MLDLPANFIAMNSATDDRSEQALVWLDRVADLLDNRFRFPGTQFRFGIDALIGLVPYAGDIVTFCISGFLIIAMARYGASGKSLLKMVGNIWLDGVVGTVPLIGDLFDFRYRANMRNVNLMREHFGEGKHRGSAWGIIFLIVLTLLLMITLSVYVIYRIGYWIIS